MIIEPSEMNDAELLDLLRESPPGSPAIHPRLLRLQGPPRVGRFEVSGLLGGGAMGIVYAARDTDTDEPVALELMVREHELGDSTEDARARLLREGWVAGQLDHPAIVRVRETGVVGDRLYLVMDRILGGTLDRWHAETSPDWVAILDILRQAGEGLASAHGAGYVHRDIKPTNILVDGDERAYLVDFGLARPILRSIDIVDAEYLAPELRAGARANPASDQYAFCVMAAKLLEINPGLQRSSIDGVPLRLCAAIARGLQRLPKDRWPDVDSLLAAMHEA